MYKESVHHVRIVWFSIHSYWNCEIQEIKIVFKKLFKKYNVRLYTVGISKLRVHSRQVHIDESTDASSAYKNFGP